MNYRRVKNLSPIVPIVSPINFQCLWTALYFLYKVPIIFKNRYRPIPPIPRWFFFRVTMITSKVPNQISGV